MRVRLFLGVLLAVALAVFGSASCRSVVAGDSVAVAAALCEQIEACYGSEAPSFADIEASLREASPETVDAFLKGFELEACLASCTDSRACLDSKPFCAVIGACEHELDCCGWSRGEAACGGELPEAAGACCLPDGVACGPDDICCDSPCTGVKGEGEGRACGGIACSTVGTACEANDECCTGICFDGACQLRDCAPLFEPCQINGDCCPPPPDALGLAPIVVCQDNRCQPKQDGGTCGNYGEFCTPDGTYSCCMDPCVLHISQQFGGCGLEPCREGGWACFDDTQCCSGICDDNSLTCSDVCIDAGLFCSQDFECCTGDCTDQGLCAGAPACADSVCHDVCFVGPPMAAGACPDTPDAPCIDWVASSDPWCACVEWDSPCVQLANELCGYACLVPF